MTTVIVPGAPRPVPADPQIRLPAPPVWAGIRYHDWFRKYGSIDNYKAYKRTRKWRAGGARHGGGEYGAEYEREYNRDPLTHAWNDVSRYLAGRPWNSKDEPRAGDKSYHDWRGRGWLYDGKQWVRNYDKPDWTDHFDWLDANMRTKGDYPNRLKHKWNQRAKDRHAFLNENRAQFSGKPTIAGPGSKWTNIKRKSATMRRTMRYRRFRPGFFNRDDHY
jgi:hypothetical protein